MKTARTPVKRSRRHRRQRTDGNDDTGIRERQTGA